jgi:hypothetical protein
MSISIAPGRGAGDHPSGAELAAAFDHPCARRCEAGGGKIARSRGSVLRARESPASIHRLCEIRDAANNMPAVNAIRALEQIGDEQRIAADSTTPGICINIISPSAPPAPRTIDQ